MYKFETVVPIAFEITDRAAKGLFAGDPIGKTRRESRDMFRKTRLLERHIPGIEEML
jgi:CRISPR-associated protein Cas1